MFEVFLRMPSFHFDTDNVIEATVEHEFTFDKIGYGNCLIRYLGGRSSTDLIDFSLQVVCQADRLHNTTVQ